MGQPLNCLVPLRDFVLIVDRTESICGKSNLAIYWKVEVGIWEGLSQSRKLCKLKGRKGLGQDDGEVDIMEGSAGESRD